MHMPRWVGVALGSALVALLLITVAMAGGYFNKQPLPDEIICIADAMQCPDGSYVGRTGSECTFVCPVSTTTPAVPAPSKSATVEAGINRSATQLGIGILPLTIIEDSRCPVDVECIWAGRLRVKVRIHNAMGDSDKEFVIGQTITTKTETITLVQAAPIPHAGVTITPADYSFIFEIKKL